VSWTVILVQEVDDWFIELTVNSPETAELVAAAIDLLAETGPTLGRPLVDRIEGSRLHNMKELRPGSQGRSEVRILFMFDPDRQAVLLVAGDKQGQWTQWYEDNIAEAERRYQRWLDGDYIEEIR
jgi:hypothetical protein